MFEEFMVVRKDFEYDNLNIKLVSVRAGIIPVNCYLVVNKSLNEGVIIDPGGKPEKIADAVSAMGFLPTAILLTHGHYDHIFAVDRLVEKYKCSVYISDADRELLYDAAKNGSLNIERREYTVQLREVTGFEDSLNAAGFDFKIIRTPGHTAGSVCISLPEYKLLFSGDTLMKAGFGRTDLVSGSFDAMKQSLDLLLNGLPQDTDVFPGHGESTKISFERSFNPIYTEFK